MGDADVIITHRYWEFKRRLNSRARLLEMLTGDSSLNSRACLLECLSGTPYISVIVFGIPHLSPFGEKVPNGFPGEQAEVCLRGRRGVHDDVKEASGIRQGQRQRRR
jgi:hypothetical protein